MKVLITGAQGFTGRNLITALQKTQASIELYETGLKPENRPNFFPLNLQNQQKVFDLINTLKPDQIYHLAGSFSNDYATDYQNNVESTRHILEAIHQLNLPTKVLLIGSAAEYGKISEKDNPINENQPLNPISVYGLTKVIQYELAQYYIRKHNLAIVFARTFNLKGKGCSPKLFVGRLNQQIEAVKSKKATHIQLYNLDGKRDFIPVAKAVNYYQLIMEKGAIGTVYNVAAGVSTPVKDLLSELLEEANLPFSIVKVQNIQNRGVKEIYADISKLSLLEKSTVWKEV